MAGDILKIALSPIGAVAGVFNKPKAPKPVLPQPTATPRSNSLVADAIASRRGSADNQRTGSRGAESTTTKKNTLMGQ
ncbi:hypothetical protein [Stakelama pacifica]|uniref:Uncharacterized protein n=1 Tax=Stakelama pacifica TaxID=517720 RepID=A0A4R6FN21_9SPHN|nr:hypothetical protein [Stakelama pacifica]TDN82982.1 hypothetical protein EV664_105180 [Stakelama pacifica]GGO95009.1 hypothetical protein GCM10011329_18180 [Stakelama pacifica]